jgi:hypothetical protein
MSTPCCTVSASARSIALGYPTNFDEGSVEELEDWLELIIRKMRRVNSIPAKGDPNKPKGQQG